VVNQFDVHVCRTNLENLFPIDYERENGDHEESIISRIPAIEADSARKSLRTCKKSANFKRLYIVSKYDHVPSKMLTKNQSHYLAGYTLRVLG
jgi:hypothetical protein